MYEFAVQDFSSPEYKEEASVSCLYCLYLTIKIYSARKRYISLGIKEGFFLLLR